MTVVLIGAETWKRKHVDWEIGASIRETEHNPRSGLLGILLPTYPRPHGEPNNYFPNTIPPRLYDNTDVWILEDLQLEYRAESRAIVDT